jgi:uncharacterized phage-like protein YoqJ
VEIRLMDPVSTNNIIDLRECVQMKTTVVNRKAETFDVYIGRGSKWGNPFSHKTGTKAEFVVASRDEAVESYREWIQTQPHLLNSLHELKGRVLGCYCKPARCHGDILAELADQVEEESIVSTIVCFTGHRPKDMYGYDETVAGNITIRQWLKVKCEAVIKKHGDVHFISGGALGIDTWAAEVVLELREQYPQTTLEIAVPCKAQDSKWVASAKKRYRQILDDADVVTYVSDKKYDNVCMQNRNEYMVDNADAVIGVWSGKGNGGTWNCLDYAEKLGRPMLLLNPKDFRILKVRKGGSIFTEEASS